MIILYDKNEQAFTSLGIGVLDDVISCVVTEELNGAFELEMDYPITGVHYSDLQERRIIYAKANDILGQQPFRIYKITRPIDGTVTVYAEHISYDMSSVPVRKINADNLNDLAGPNGKIQNGKVINSPFMFYIGDDKQSGNDVYYKTTKPYNMRSLLMGSDESILNIYNGEFIFDKFNVTLCDRRGSDRGFTIRYSKNMIDLEQETSSELMYDGILPYYSNTTTETKVGIGKKYVEIYIADKNVQPLTDIDGQQVFPTTWLTYKSSGLEPITEIAKLSVVNIIATEGEYYNHLVSGKRTKLSENDETKPYFIDVTYNIAYINKSFPNEFKYGWLYKDEDITQVWQPTNGQLFRIFTPGDKLYKVYIFEGDTQTGVYREITNKDDVKEYGPTIPSPDTTQEEKETLLQYEGDIIYINEVRALPKEGQTQTSPTWLYKVNEVEQLINSDPRWEPVAGGDIIQTIGVPSTIIYKVPRDEQGIVAYPIDGVEVDAPGWLTLYEGSTEPLMPDGVTPFVPVDQQLYNVVKPESQGGGFSKRRWFEEENKYAMAVDTRCLYSNYEWNGTEYVEHSTVNDKILTLDISDNFKEVPSPSARFQKNLYDYTLKYIEDNKLGTLKKSIKVSFVKLSSSPEYSKWKELETVVLGDTVHVIYEELGVNEQKKVIKTEYNVLTETYDSIEIGDKGTGFVDTAITQGDSISALTNDRNFADITTVTKLIANTIDADYIHAVTAELSNAQIDTLTAGDVTARVVTAEKFDIDNLVASLLTADDAAIRNTLVVGENLIVNGEVNIVNGSISISTQERINSARIAYYNPEKTVEDVDFLLSDPNDASSVIMPELGIWYKVEDLVTHYYIWQYPTDEEDGKYVEQEPGKNVYFDVDTYGNVTANSLSIKGGSIEIEEKIIDCMIDSEQTEYGPNWLYTEDSQGNPEVIEPEVHIVYRVTLQNNEYELYRWIPSEDPQDDGHYEKTSYTATVFSVDNYGCLTANNVNIEGRIVATSGRIGDAYIVDNHLQVDNVDIKELSADRIKGGTLKSSEIRLDAAIEGLIDSEVTPYSEDWLYQEEYDYEQAKYVKKTIEPKQNTYYYVASRNKYYIWNGTTYEESITEPTYFEVDDEGNVTANSLEITGGKISISGDSSLFSVDQYGTLNANSVKLTGGEIENLDITGYLFFKSKNYTTAYTMTSIGTTSYSDGYLIYTSDNSYMEFDGDYAYEDGVLTLTSHAIEALSDEEVQQYSQNWLYQEVYNYEHAQYEKVTIVPEQNKYYYVDNTKYYIWNGTSYEESNDNYHRNYIRNTNNTEISYSVYSFDRLSEHNPVTDEIEGPALTPVLDKTYLIMDYKDGYSKSAELLGLYKWNGTSYVKQQDEVYYISEDGFYLPYIRSTLNGAAIAGFDVDENTITSSTATTEVGLSSDTSEPAFWAGKEVNGKHPFEVSQLGELITTSGKIADLLIAKDYLTSNPNKTSHIADWEEPGILIDSSGITITDTDGIFVRMCYGTIITNSIEINWKNLNTVDAQEPYLPIKPSKITKSTIDIDNVYYGYEVEDFIYQPRKTFIWNLSIWCKANTWTKISVPSEFYPKYVHANIHLGKDAFDNNPISNNTTILTDIDLNTDVYVLVRYSADYTFDVYVSIILEYIPNPNN